jgi:hypothetical protein
LRVTIGRRPIVEVGATKPATRQAVEALFAGVHTPLVGSDVEICDGGATRRYQERERYEGEDFDACHSSLLRTYLADICSTMAAKIPQTAPMTKVRVAGVVPMEV